MNRYFLIAIIWAIIAGIEVGIAIDKHGFGFAVAEGGLAAIFALMGVASEITSNK
jgi:hypothetical protein